jgi:demethylspheroidene O-methyltransferase
MKATTWTSPVLATAGGTGSWWDRCLSWRDRCLTHPRFQRLAAGFWLTQPIARRRARALFDLVAGFVYSQVLLACVRLGVFERLAQRPHTAAELAEHWAMEIEPCERLLAAAVSLRLLERRRGGRYGLGPLGAPLVGQTGIAAMVEHHAALYQDLADPVALLRCAGDQRAGHTQLSSYWSYAADAQPGALPSPRVAAYSRLMSASQPLVAQEILDAYPVHYHRCVLDVGGGEGSFLAAAAERADHLQLMLFDLPAVAQRADAALAARGLASRSTVTGGDFLRDELPRGADLVSLVRVLHDHDDAAAMQLLRAARRALPDEGCLLLAEPMAGTAGAEPMGDAYFGLYLWAMGSGRPRTPREIAAMLQQAGFDELAWPRTRMPLQTRLVVARAAPGRAGGAS